MPTETVYGLAADAANPRAIAAVFEAKGRPRFNPLIAHVTGPGGRAGASPSSTSGRWPWPKPSGPDP